MDMKYYSRYLTVEMPDGNKKSLKFYGKTLKEAEKKRDEAKLKVQLGILKFNSKTLFVDIVRQYMEQYIKPNYDDFQYQMMYSMLENVFIIDLEKISISDIKPTILRTCLNKTQGKSRSYVNKIYMLINGVFNMAQADGLISMNPMHSVQRIKSRSGSRRALTEYERKIFSKVIYKHDKGIAFVLMMGCGLRPGEVRALKWEDVNLEKREINIKQAFKKQLKKNHANMKIGIPKTEAGIRTIPMPEVIYEMLKNMNRNQCSFVVTNKNGDPLTEQAFRRSWQSFYRLMQIEAGAKLYRNQIVVYADKIGKDLTPYYLRHTYATILAENDVKIKVAQRYMGHSTTNMLMEIYTHCSEQMVDEAKRIVSKMLITQKSE